MSDFANLIRREAAQPANARAPIRVAEVTSYNPKTHAVKVKVQPEGVETGWMPLGSHHIGDGFGIAVGANVGDQVLVGYLEGDHSAPVVMGRLFSDQQKPPKVESGEMVLWHGSGTRTFFAKDGSITHTHANGATRTWDKDGNHATDLKGRAKTTVAGTVGTKAGSVKTDTPKKVVTGTVHLAAGGTTV